MKATIDQSWSAITGLVAVHCTEPDGVADAASMSAPAGRLPPASARGGHTFASNARRQKVPARLAAGGGCLLAGASTRARQDMYGGYFGLPNR